MKIVWLLYQQEDLSANRDYARLMRENGLKRDMKIETVLTREPDASAGRKWNAFLSAQGQEGAPGRGHCPDAGAAVQPAFRADGRAGL